MSAPLQPLGDYVVAVAEEASNKTASGLYIPESSQEKPKYTKVVAVGPAVHGIKVGDQIISKSFTSTEVKVDGKEYTIVKEEDILATVK